MSLFCLLGALTGHLLDDVLKPIQLARPATAPPQQVLVFIHLPKCGGTTVRDIFHVAQRQHGWSTTYWSMTQRIYGWKSNRILHGIASKLRSNSSKVFVEWHLGPNVSFIPDMKRYVHMMRPDVEFRSFIILRSPTSFVVSNGAYWQPRADPEDVIKKMPEALLASIVGAGEVRTYLLRSHGDAFTEAGADVAIDLPPVPAGPGTTKEPQNVTGFDQSAWLRNAREKLGCEPLVSAALHALAGLDQVLFLDDNTTIPNIHAVAQHGDASFRSRLTAEELSRTKTPHSASTSKRVKERYSTPKLIALTERENECSLLLWKRIRQSWSSSRVTGATEPSLTLRGAGGE